MNTSGVTLIGNRLKGDTVGNVKIDRAGDAAAYSQRKIKSPGFLCAKSKRSQ